MLTKTFKKYIILPKYTKHIQNTPSSHIITFFKARLLTKNKSGYPLINDYSSSINESNKAKSTSMLKELKVKLNEIMNHKYINNNNPISGTNSANRNKPSSSSSSSTAPKTINKLHARQRVLKLLDLHSPFLEFSQFAGYNLYPEDLPCGGVITGIGLIKGIKCVIIANDSTITAGSLYPITVKKILRAQTIAMENNLPCVYIVESAGIHLPRQNESFADDNQAGTIFHNQANMSAAGIPQIAIVMGYCVGVGAYIAAMCDESIILKSRGAMFLGGPSLVKAATGEVVTIEELGGADVHSKISGVTDHLVYTEEEALLFARNIVSGLNLPKSNLMSLTSHDWEEPLYDPQALNYLYNPDDKTLFDPKLIIARIVDGSRFQEFKQEYGITLITGFAKLYGNEIGIIANNGVLLSESVLKGAHFIELCSQRKIPILFLQNVPGFMVGQDSEHSGLAKHGAKMVHALSVTKSPKITLIFGGSYGAGNFGMCGRGMKPRFLFTWPAAKVCVMGGLQAAETLMQLKKKRNFDKETEQRMKKAIMEDYEQQSSCYYASARLWDDGIIIPSDTRKVLVQ